MTSSDRRDDPAGGDGIRVTVDGNVFDIVALPGRPGEYNYRWVSGPIPDYGFSSASSNKRRLEMLDHVNAIRNFLTQINPKTGYIE